MILEPSGQGVLGSGPAHTLGALLHGPAIGEHAEHKSTHH